MSHKDFFQEWFVNIHSLCLLIHPKLNNKHIINFDSNFFLWIFIIIHINLYFFDQISIFIYEVDHTEIIFL